MILIIFVFCSQSKIVPNTSHCNEIMAGADYADSYDISS